MMKYVKNQVAVIFFGLMITIGCQSVNNGDLTSFNENTVDELVAAENEIYLSDELAKVDASGIQIEDADAVFSIGWRPYYNPDENQMEIHSHAFAVAPKQDSDDQVFFRSGLDMGEVNLYYDTSTIKLNKIDVHNRGFFYEYGKQQIGGHGGMHSMGTGALPALNDQENFVEIPYLPGEIYKFETTGTDDFSGLTVEAAAPDNNVQISAPFAGAVIDTTKELKVTWSGGVADQNLIVILMPEIDSATFRSGVGGHRSGHGMRPLQGNQERGLPDPNSSFGGLKLKHPLFSEYAARYLVEQNTGEFTFSIEDIRKVLSHENVTGLRLEVMQTSINEIYDGSAKYVVQFRLGDLIQLQMQ